LLKDYGLEVQRLFLEMMLQDASSYVRVQNIFNPDNFDAWRVLYLISKSSPEEKALALENMKRLDPKNPNVLG
jgi:hypothetical protein